MTKTPTIDAATFRQGQAAIKAAIEAHDSAASRALFLQGKAAIEAGEGYGPAKKPRKPRRKVVAVCPPPAALTPLPVHFDVPMPPSVNHAYASVIDNNTGKRKRVLTDKAREYRKQVLAGLPPVALDPRLLYTLHFFLTYPWQYGNGKLRKFDETNRIKLLEDIVVKAIGVDDANFKRPRMASIDSPVYAVRVTILPLQPNVELP